MRTALGLLLLTSTVVRAAPEATYIQIAGRDVAVWKPASPSASGAPVIVFSHGFTGCATQSTFLMEALARAGYLVLAPNHKDAACTAGGRASLGKLLSIRPEEPFRKEQEWSAQTYKDRAADIEAVLDALAKDPALAGVAADMARIGMAGHSLGGYTALGLGGAWPSWKDPRIKAVLALSPFCSPYVSSGALDRMNIAVMYQGGTADLGVTPTVKRLSGAYGRTSAPKYYVEFQGAGHFAWTNINPAYQDLISRYSTAFFDQYVKGQPASGLSALMDAKPLPKRVSDLRASR